MSYRKKALMEADIDEMRITLSVRQKKISSEPKCDFCGDDQPIFAYASRRMESGIIVDCWRWCACEDCSVSLDRRDWEAVLSKISKWLAGRLPYPKNIIRHAARTSFQEFINYAIWEP